MTGILLVCVSLLVGTGEIGHKALDTAPFSVGRVVEEVSRNAGHSSRRGSLLGDWEHAVGSGLLEEFIIDASITYVDKPGSQGNPSIAFDGTNYLVVWDDRGTGSDSDIYGARVDSSGRVLDLLGIAISTESDWQHTPSVAFDGTNYLVVWSASRSGVSSNIYGSRVDTSGAVLDTLGIAISTVADDQRHPSIAFGSAYYLVAWHDYRNGSNSDIYGARVDKAGAVLDTSGIAISTAMYSQRTPSIAFDGTNYLVVWRDYGSGSSDDIYGARIDTSGMVLDPWNIRICDLIDYQLNPAVAFGANDYFVVWQDHRNGSWDIYGTRIDSSGAVLDRSGIIISDAGGHQWYPAVAYDAVNYLVVWHDGRIEDDLNIMGARIDTSGTVIDTAGIAVSTAPGTQFYPSVEFGASDYFVVWDDTRSGLSRGIYGARVETSGAVLDPSGLIVSTAADWQRFPSLVFDSTNYFVVWQDYRGETEDDIYGARVDPFGTVIDSPAIPICTTTYHQIDPSAAFDGTNYFAVWCDHRNSTAGDIYGARVNTSGEVIEISGIPISTADGEQSHPSVAFDGTKYLVVWMDFSNPPSYDIYGARVDTSGTVLDSTAFPITTRSANEWFPSIAFDGINYLVVWLHEDDSEIGCNVRGTRVDTAAVVLDTSGLEIATSRPCPTYRQHPPSLAFDGSRYLVVWHESHAGSRCDIYAAIVRPSGVVDPLLIAVSTADGNQYCPSVAFTGRDYLVIWHDYRSGSNYDIYGARVDSLGRVLDPSGLKLLDQPRTRERPAVAAGSGDKLLLVYNGFAPQPYNSDRVFGAFYTGVGIEEEVTELHAKRLRFELFQNKPNPFNDGTVIGYSLPASAPVTLKVYDSSGRMMRMLVDEEKSAGRHTATWNGRDTSDRELPSGIYFCRLQTGESTLTRKMIFLK